MIQLPKPAPGFDDPLGLLAACHARIEAQCELLQRLREHLGKIGNDTQASQAARRIRQYFTTAGQHHHEDEEQDFFPMLALHAETEGRADILALMDELRRDHARLNALWEVLSRYLDRIVAGEQVAPELLPLTDFVQGNLAHISQENALILPFAREIMSKEDLRELGKALAARRSNSQS